jgi:hypothetical protein
MAALPFAFTRTLFGPDEVAICSCNYCFATIGESGNHDVLDALEQAHLCPQLEKASEEFRRHTPSLPSNVTSIDSILSPAPYAFTRRFFAREQVVVSSCNRCFVTVAESNDDSVLEARELRHSCTRKAGTSDRLGELEPKLLVAV